MVFNHDDSQVDYLGYKELFIMDDGGKYEITSDDKLSESDYSKIYNTIGNKLFKVENAGTEIFNKAFAEAIKEKKLKKYQTRALKIKLYMSELNKLQRVRVSPHTQNFTVLYSIPIRCYQHVWILELL